MRIVVAAAAAVLATTPVRAELLRGSVVRVHDGDTIGVLDDSRRLHRIRIAAIDAPEPGQAFSERSRRHLSSLVLRKTVDVEWTRLDRYGRQVGKVRLAESDVGALQLRAGMAWHFREFAREQSPADRLTYAQAEALARAQRIGLWSNPHATPPWEFRRLRAPAFSRSGTVRGISRYVGRT